MESYTIDSFTKRKCNETIHYLFIYLLKGRIMKPFNLDLLIIQSAIHQVMLLYSFVHDKISQSPYDDAICTLYWWRQKRNK